MAEVLAAPTGDYREALAERGPCTLAVGMFDGVHLGHQHILRAAVAEAERQGIHAAALTFDPHPAERVGGRAFRYLTTLSERLARVAATGISTIRVVPFVDELARLSPEQWAEQVLAGRLHVRTMVVGTTHRFGAGGAGDGALLTKLGERLGFTVTVVPHAALREGDISSSRIREALGAGDVTLATRMLGRPYALEGPVVTGVGKGRTLGFPTANLVPPDDRALPGHGVYACAVETAGRAYAAGVHVGPVPTFEREAVVIECHLLGFSGDLVGTPIRVEFLERLRGIERFAGQEQLVEALHRDLTRAGEIASVEALAACEERAAQRAASPPSGGTA
jgi:riboflavin kinase / FMN adenylyltransferase